MKNLFLLSLVVLMVSSLRGADDVSLNVSWIPSTRSEVPKLTLKIENHTKQNIVVQAYKKQPMVSLDLWYNYEGLVLMESSQYRVTMGGFVVLEPILIPPGKDAAFELDLKKFVPLGGENRGTDKWLEDLANANSLRVSARVKIDQVERCSDCASTDDPKELKKGELKKS